jgi:hypothetical protein
MSDIVEILIGNADERRRFVFNTPTTINDLFAVENELGVKRGGS